MSTPQLSGLARTGYELLIAGASSLKSPFLLIVRLYWGWQMFVTPRKNKTEIPRYGAQSGVDLLGYGAKCTRKQTQL